MNSIVVVSGWTVVRQDTQAVLISSFTDENFIIPREILEKADVTLSEGDELEGILTCNSETNEVYRINIDKISLGCIKRKPISLWEICKSKLNKKKMTEGG